MKTRKYKKRGGKPGEETEEEIVIDHIATLRYNMNKYGKLDPTGIGTCPTEIIKLFLGEIDEEDKDEEASAVEKKKNKEEAKELASGAVKKLLSKNGGRRKKKRKTRRRKTRGIKKKYR